MRRGPGRGAGASALVSGGYDFCLVGAIQFITSGLLAILDSCFWVRFSYRRAILDNFSRRFPGRGLCGRRSGSGYQNFESFFDDAAPGNFSRKLIIYNHFRDPLKKFVLGFVFSVIVGSNDFGHYTVNRRPRNLRRRVGSRQCRAERSRRMFRGIVCFHFECGRNWRRCLHI